MKKKKNPVITEESVIVKVITFTEKFINFFFSESFSKNSCDLFIFPLNYCGKEKVFERVCVLIHCIF